MKNKEKSAAFVHNYEPLLRCPLCQSSMKVAQFKSLVCLNKHTFDFAKQGYINMMTRPVKSHYDRTLFEARHAIITKSGLYAQLHAMISEVLNRHMMAPHDEKIILDAGCGEGSHLQRILDTCNKKITGIGLDISKEGIRMAASKYKDSIWFVGDLANLPLAAQSCHAILNILSPANYKEFKRILVQDGLVMKVVPRSHYLKELREAMFDNRDKKSYKNEETVSLFKQHFHLVDVFTVSYSIELNQTNLRNLVQMSPLSWNSKEEQIAQFLKRGSSEITVDLDILIGKNMMVKGGWK